MKGSILNFDETTRQGIISGEDGNRYELNMSEWKSSQLPKTGSKVDFTASENTAQEIYLEASTATSSKKIPAALFAFFLGSLGIHKFYLGYKKQGFIMMIVFLLGFILLGLPSIIIGIIAFIEFIIYLTKTEEDFDRIYVQNKKAWF
ncbi:TM2 domain-containing protein [Vibrio parahaemolyticus]|uniref:TM2 domain-containing protein n=1 Tax=Vibrio TaxID=662 RepID=UPI001A90B2D9|nr:MULTISPECIES: TM2 domain-containing protein [Vibrio]EGQ7973476.1 TM2 domain-containing protein [Vibrio parahaemolyticus]MBO0208622.1 TM2 domain-containing protein [Vibrio sp. Vb0877]MCR9810915.1 TM2 domain-containing protein [Vibrio parahaemolyticus]